TALAPTDWLEDPSTTIVYPPGVFEPEVVTVTASVPTSGRPSSARGLGLWESLHAPATTSVAAAAATKLQPVLRAIVAPSPVSFVPPQRRVRRGWAKTGPTRGAAETGRAWRSGAAPPSRTLRRARAVAGAQQRVAALLRSGQPRSRSRKSRSLSSSNAPAMFSSRCWTLDVPGMGSITGERLS